MDDDTVLMPSDPSITERLAQSLDLPLIDFVNVLGAGWLPLPDGGFDVDPASEGSASGPWHVSGTPYQLTLRTRKGGMELGIPVGSWSGSHSLQWESHDRRTIDAVGSELLEAARPIVAALLKRRRARFRYCRYCRSLTPPEERFEADVCDCCASTWRGVIF